MTDTKRRAELREYAISRLEDMKGYDQEASEVHNEIFNSDYYIIERYHAEQWLSDDVFEIMGIIKDYEQDNFGKVTTDLTEAERVVNMYVYILGEEVLAESEHLGRVSGFNKCLSDYDIDQIIKELKEGV